MRHISKGRCIEAPHRPLLFYSPPLRVRDLLCSLATSALPPLSLFRQIPTSHFKLCFLWCRHLQPHPGSTPLEKFRFPISDFMAPLAPGSLPTSHFPLPYSPSTFRFCSSSAAPPAKSSKAFSVTSMMWSWMNTAPSRAPCSGLLMQHSHSSTAQLS